MSRADNSHHLQRAAAARHDAAVTRAHSSIEQLDRTGSAITFTAVADAAGVSRGWLYNQPDLRATITGLRHNGKTAAATVIPAAQRATNDSLLQRLDGSSTTCSVHTEQPVMSRLWAANALANQNLAPATSTNCGYWKRACPDFRNLSESRHETEPSQSHGH